MIRKTFTNKQEAQQYNNDQNSNGNVAILYSLGDKFRVYVETQGETEKMKSWRRDNWDKCATERYLRGIAWKAKEAIDNVLALKKSIESGEIYNDYESAIEAARIMAEIGELKTANDVFYFIDDTHHYDKILKQIIDETFEEYDYEAKEEVAKE